MTNKEYADNLRLIANFYDAHPGLPLPYNFERINLSGVYGRTGLASVARIFGDCEKEAKNGFYYVKKRIGAVTLTAYDWQANVCERVVVGTRLVRKELPTAFETKEEMEEIVEWKCPDSLLNGNGNEPDPSTPA